jgi:IS30 family transposase
MTDNQKTQIRTLRMRGLGYIKIAQVLGISENTVKSFCRRNNLSSKFVQKENVLINDDISFCRKCNTEIHQIKGRKPRTFCCDECRKLYWKENQDKIIRKTAKKLVCPICSKDFYDYTRNNRKYCSHTCYIKARYQGGKDSGK